MLIWPARAPLSASSRFPGGFFKSSIVRDASTWRSFLKARSCIPAGNFRLDLPCQMRLVSLQLNDRIISEPFYKLIHDTYQVSFRDVKAAIVIPPALRNTPPPGAFRLP